MSDTDKADETLSYVLNAPIRALGSGCAQNYCRVQISDVTGHMDFAPDTTISNTLILRDLDQLKPQILLNDEPQKGSEQTDLGEVVKVSYEMRLKDRVIERVKKIPGD